MVHDVFGHWTLTKGKLKDDETDEKNRYHSSCKRKIGVDLTVEDKLGENEYIAYHPEEGKRKRVMYFLAKAPYKDLKLEEGNGGLDDAKWFKLADILDLNFYNDILPIVTKAINFCSRNLLSG